MAMLRVRFAGLAAALLVCLPAMAQQAAHEFRGAWTATAGNAVLRGDWTATIAPRKPNAARGTWTLLGETDQVMAHGTWSAEKTSRGWEGTWTARVLPASPGGGHGRTYSGAWQAEVTEPGAKTFADMLAATAKKAVTGAWQSGGARGNWWLEGYAPPGKR